MKSCPSTRYTLRLPIGNILAIALKRNHKATALSTETWKLQFLQAWFEQDRKNGEGKRRLRRINFSQELTLTFYCEGCGRIVGKFEDIICQQWQAFSAFVFNE